jgi:hypothetical protein
MEIPASNPRKDRRLSNLEAAGMAPPRARFKNPSCRFRVADVTASALDQGHTLFGSNRDMSGNATIRPLRPENLCTVQTLCAMPLNKLRASHKVDPAGCRISCDDRSGRVASRLFINSNVLC